MYVVLHKEKPGIDSIRGFNVAVIMPITVQLAAVSE
jgi:hypothetical protein